MARHPRHGDENPVPSEDTRPCLVYSDVRIQKTVPCTGCASGEVTLPRTATGLLPTALCLACAQALENDGNTHQRQHWDDQRTQQAQTVSVRNIHDVCPPALQKTPYDGHLRGLTRGAFILTPPGVDVAAVAYRALALAVPERPSVARRIGGGPESLTLAAATRAGFDDVKKIRETYLSPLHTSVVITGLGGGGYLNVARRHAEYVALADQVTRSSQFLILAASEPWPGAAAWFGDIAHQRLRAHLDAPIILPNLE